MAIHAYVGQKGSGMSYEAGYRVPRIFYDADLIMACYVKEVSYLFFSRYYAVIEIHCVAHPTVPRQMLTRDVLRFPNTVQAHRRARMWVQEYNGRHISRGVAKQTA